MKHTQGALIAAEIILNGKPTIWTGYGKKTLEGLAELIDRMTAAPELLQGCNAALAYLADPASKFSENRQEAAKIIRAAIAKVEG